MRGYFTLIQLPNRLSSFASILLVLILAAGPLRAYPDSLEVSLSEVIEQALKASPRILASESGVRQARGMEVASLAGNLPHLSLSETFNRGNDPVFSFGSKLRQSAFTAADFDLPRLNEPAAITNYSTRVLVEQPLFNGGQSYYGRKSAKAMHSAASHSSDYTKQQTIYDVRRAYYSLILARENLAVLDAAMEVARGYAMLGILKS